MRRIQRYLSEKTPEELTEAIMDLAGQHRRIRDDLLQKAQLASEPLSYTQLKGMIDGIAPVDDWWDFRQVRRYFHALESILARIEAFADRIEPLVLLRAVEHAIKRLADIGPLHDLGDYPEDSREMVRELHIETASRLNWAPAELASYLIDCSLRDGWDPFSDAPDVYTNRLGEALHTAIIAELRSRLSALSERSGDGDPDHEAVREYFSQTLEWLTEPR